MLKIPRKELRDGRIHVAMLIILMEERFLSLRIGDKGRLFVEWFLLCERRRDDDKWFDRGDLGCTISGEFVVHACHELLICILNCIKAFLRHGNRNEGHLMSGDVFVLD